MKLKVFFFIFGLQSIICIYSFDINAQERKIESDDCIESLEFLNSNIEYFNLDEIDEKKCSVKSYYIELLKEHTSNPYLNNDFIEGHYQYDYKKVYIRNYGLVYVGIIIYLDYVASRQPCDFIFINKDKKQLVIWHYANIIFKKSYLKVDFITRGKHSYENIIYSNKIGRFIPLCYR